MYIEDIFSKIVRNAASSGLIEGLKPSNVFTDATSSNEWKGENKVFIVRGKMSLIGDVTAQYGYSGYCQTEITIAVIGKDKEESLALIHETQKAINRTVNKETGLPDGITIEDGEEITIETTEIMTIDESETVYTNTINAIGTVTGDGFLIADTITGNVLESLIYESAMNDVASMSLTGIDGIERFESGSFRDQYFQTRKFSVVHNVTIV